MYAPQLGPSNPFKTQQAAAQKNMFCGFVENTGVSIHLPFAEHISPCCGIDSCA
jgi:hypothetical protein